MRNILSQRKQKSRGASYHMLSHVRVYICVFCQLLINSFHPTVRQTGRTVILYCNPFPFFYWVLCSMRLVLATRLSYTYCLSRLPESQARIPDLMRLICAHLRGSGHVARSRGSLDDGKYASLFCKYEIIKR